MDSRLPAEQFFGFADVGQSIACFAVSGRNVNGRVVDKRSDLIDAVIFAAADVDDFSSSGFWIFRGQNVRPDN
ncbi:MAG: hypothetical protein UX55_C0032G0007, partial [Candidatus Azambacteria bacterium GW2011_GWE2_46_45]